MRHGDSLAAAGSGIFSAASTAASDDARDGRTQLSPSGVSTTPSIPFCAPATVSSTQAGIAAATTGVAPCWAALNLSPVLGAPGFASCTLSALPGSSTWLLSRASCCREHGPHAKKLPRIFHLHAGCCAAPWSPGSALSSPPPPRIAASPPRRLAASPPRRLLTSPSQPALSPSPPSPPPPPPPSPPPTPPRLASPRLAASSPRVAASSPCLAASSPHPPRLCHASSPRLAASSSPRLAASSPRRSPPRRLVASSPHRLIAIASPPPRLASPPLRLASPPPRLARLASATPSSRYFSDTAERSSRFAPVRSSFMTSHARYTQPKVRQQL